MTQPPLRIALAGLGTVGIGVIRLIESNAALLESRAGRALEITAVSARDRTRERGIDMSAYAFEADMRDLAARDDVDVVVELVGGEDGPALDLARATFAAGKGLVTANKAMVAHHGLDLAARAQEKGAPFKFEAAVAGGIPVLKALREGAAANAIEKIHGILNGTCNYILSTMERTGRDFSEVLAEAQALGFAEADPAFDIEGVDAAHKLSILAAIAFGAKLDFAGVETDGIERIRAADITQAKALGYVIRLIGNACLMRGPDGAMQLFQRVQPHLVPHGHPLALVAGPTNAVVTEGNFSGRLLFQGAGAGDKPTASAVMADILDIARGEVALPFSVPVDDLEPFARADAGERVSQAYLRFAVSDKPGVLAEIAAAMRDAGVSIESLIQHGRENEGGEVLVALVTHEGPEKCVAEALRLLADSPSLTAQPLVMHVLRDQ
jgi:homoserine dehydrogenase